MRERVQTRIGLAGRIARVAAVIALMAAWSWTLVGSAAASGTPDVTVAKTSSASGPLHVGDTFTYTITVTNTGTGDAQKVHVQDDLPVGLRPTSGLPPFPGGQCTVASSVAPPAPEHWSVTCTRSVLAAGDSVATSFDVRIGAAAGCGDLTNTASVEASNEPAAAQGDDEASITDTVTCPPSVEMTKTAPRFAHIGATVRFTMHVTNTGHLPLSHVAVADPGCDTAPKLRGDGNGDSSLSRRETWTFACTHVVRADAPDRLATTAVVRASSSGGPAHASARAATRVLRPQLTVSVSPTPVSGTPGDTITYRYVVRNTGNATLTAVAVVDDQLGAVGTAATLVPGHSATFTVDRVLTARHPWVSNTASATGSDPSGHAVTASDHAAVTIVAGSGAGNPNGGGDGTAFTGGDTTLPAVAALLLAIAGITALVLADRRRS
jgi:uncharacterized repeat protein (TIGR01451 family)